MKKIKNILVIAIIVITALNCKNEAQPEIKTVETQVEAIKQKLDPNATYAKAEFKIEGMTCEMGCAKTIEKKIAKMEGVKSAKVDFKKELAMVEYDQAKVTPNALETTVVSVAEMYKVKDMKTVDAFSSAKSCGKNCCKGKTDAEKATCKAAKKSCKENKKSCKAECKKDCCKGEKKACTKDCKKACCTNKAKA